MLIVFLALGCQKEVKTTKAPLPAVNKEIQTPESKTLAVTREILTVIKARAYTKLADYFHPVLGVRFSPYAYVDTLRNVKLSSLEFKRELLKADPLRWGEFDGSGDPIVLTVPAYFDKFVYNADFLNAEKTSFNKMFGHGNSLNNLTTIYSGNDFTESYFSGFDPKYNGMDWTCLRLVYQEYDGKLFLIAIIHDQWTS